MSAFGQAFAVLIVHEGGYSTDRQDPGNWTGGKVGSGTLKGTKYGISAASFPTLDIANLTVEQAGSIYRAMYWDRMGCDSLPPELALLVFDAAVNNGVSNAAKFLQLSVGATADGLIGTATRAAIAKTLGNGSPERVQALCSEFLARRLVFMAALSTWARYGLGWARRLCALPFQARAFSS